MSATDAEIKLCEEKHKNVDRRVDSLEKKMAWFNSLAISNLVAIVVATAIFLITGGK